MFIFMSSEQELQKHKEIYKSSKDQITLIIDLLYYKLHHTSIYMSTPTVNKNSPSIYISQYFRKLIN